MHLTAPITWLHADGTPDPREMGGKGARLARLARAGLPVPEGFCLGPAAFRRSLLRLGVAADEAVDPSCLEALRRVSLGPDLEAAVADALRRLGGGPVAVRSSALDEDGANRSFAGQYRSHLHRRGLAQVLEAIQDIWASYFDQRVRSYRGGDADGDGGMAVLVMRMVDARASGILFTVNPVSGAPRELTAEVAPGVGDRLAAGGVHPDLWVCSRPIRARRGRPREVNERAPAPARQEPCLSDAEVLDVARLALRVEQLLGAPQDVEFSVDGGGGAWLLQSRPITALREALTRARTPTTLWTQRFSGERWTEQATPLGWSIMQPVLHHFIHWEKASRRYLNDAPASMLYRGVPYFNITIFRHLVFRLPGMAPIQFMLEFFPQEEQDELRRKPVYLPNLGLVASIFEQVFRERRWRRYQFNVLTNHKVWERFVPEFEREIDALSATFADPDAGLAEFERARQLVLRYVEIHLLSLLFANLSYQLLGVALRRWAGDRDHQILAALTAAPTRNRTVDGHKAIWTLAGLAQQIPAVDRALTDPAAPPSLEELEALPDGAPFVDAVREFLDEFGHRSSASWEIFAPRWSEDPRQVLRMIAGYLEGGLHTDPFLNEERHRQAHVAAREKLRRALGKGPLGLPSWRRPTTRALTELTRSYMRLRENQRFYFDRLLFQIKRIYMRVGDQLVRQGKLARADDVVLMTQDEIAALVSGSLAADVAAERVATRRAEAKRDCDADHPDFLVGDGMPVPSSMDERRVLHGQGISPGRIRGKVRVLKDLSDVRKLQRGDILVTRATDPGWTPLFLTAGGLVMELGSLLSHGAVVAREYALPAVVNVTNATRRLQDGQEVAVDGAQGLVYIL